MGLRWRKRTKGSKSWWNFSASKSGGLGASFSFKMGNITANVGSGGRRRVTMNLGNGLVYTKSRVVKPKAKPIAPKAPVTKISSQIPAKPWPHPTPKVEQKVDNNKFADSLEKLDKTLDPIDMSKWPKRKQLTFVIVIAIICFIIQLAIS